MNNNAIIPVNLILKAWAKHKKIDGCDKKFCTCDQLCDLFESTHWANGCNLFDKNYIYYRYLTDKDYISAIYKQLWNYLPGNPQLVKLIMNHIDKYKKDNNCYNNPRCQCDKCVYNEEDYGYYERYYENEEIDNSYEMRDTDDEPYENNKYFEKYKEKCKKYENEEHEEKFEENYEQHDEIEQYFEREDYDDYKYYENYARDKEYYESINEYYEEECEKYYDEPEERNNEENIEIN